MARYRIAHDLHRTWVHKAEDGTYFWAEDYKTAELFPNYKAAKAALDTMPVEKRMYGFPYKPTFMKFYDDDDHFKREMAYQAERRGY